MTESKELLLAREALDYPVNMKDCWVVLACHLKTAIAEVDRLKQLIKEKND